MANSDLKLEVGENVSKEVKIGTPKLESDSFKVVRFDNKSHNSMLEQARADLGMDVGETHEEGDFQAHSSQDLSEQTDLIDSLKKPSLLVRVKKWFGLGSATNSVESETDKKTE